MAEPPQKAGPGGHYSGKNPIPTVKQFIENLDKDKKNRDKQLDEQALQGNQSQKQNQGDVQPHQAIQKHVKGTEKTVTDPTTGNQVVIADVNKEMMKEVENPHVVVPNANLNKPTVRIWLRNAYLVLTYPAHQNRSFSVTQGLQVQSRCHCASRPGG